MTERAIVLGDPENAREEDTLRGGSVRVLSRHGLRRPERLLLEALPEKAPRRLLTGFDTEAAVAIGARRLYGAGTAILWRHLDAYVAAKAARTLAQNGVQDVDARAATDLPGVAVPGEPAPEPVEPFDLVALPFPKGGEAILGRELIEEAHAALAQGGRLLAATDDDRGEWLKKVVKEVFGNATVAHAERKQGLVVAGRRTRASAEVRDHRHVIAATLRGRAYELESRPGVFGHVRLDAGTKALAEAAPIVPSSRLLDLGCGYGPIGLSAAASAPEGRAVLVDSNARAAALAERNAARSGLSNALVLLRGEPLALERPAFDLVLANPPYFSNFRIARAFVATAAAALEPGGQVWLVVKAADEHRAIVEELFVRVTVREAPGGYSLVSGSKR